MAVFKSDILVESEATRRGRRSPALWTSNSGGVLWGEATEEPAREDARPTSNDLETSRTRTHHVFAGPLLIEADDFFRVGEFP